MPIWSRTKESVEPFAERRWVILPAIVHLNASATIVMIGLAFLIVASLLNAAPSLVLVCASPAVLFIAHADILDDLPMVAPAGMGRAVD
jgi:hypothetical protein